MPGIFSPFCQEPRDRRKWYEVKRARGEGKRGRERGRGRARERSVRGGWDRGGGCEGDRGGSEGRKRRREEGKRV
eukprot:1682823-Rhodomonas_salina.1